MSSYIASIRIGLASFLFYTVIITLPILLVNLLRYKKINFVRIGLNYMMVLYLFCVLTLVFLPLPTTAQAMSLQAHNIQLIPLCFIADILRDTPFVLSNPRTYLPALFHGTVLQVVFNVLMTLPFGLFLRYYFGFNKKKVIIFSLLLSLFIEIGQLTGLFFLYPGSYRLCDVDDLITNTLGGYLGCCIVQAVELHIPALKAFDLALPFRKKILSA